MATLKGSTIASTYDSLVKRADTYSQTGTNIELMDDSAVIKPTGLYLESGATTDNVGIGIASPTELLHLKSSTSAKPVLRIENANADALPPYIHLVKTSASQAANDYLGVIGFKGKNDANEEIEYAFISAQSTDIADGTEDGIINFGTMKNASGSGSAASVNMVLKGANVGIGTTSPDQLLHLESATPMIVLEDSDGHSSNDEAWIHHQKSGAAGTYLSSIKFDRNGGTSGYMQFLVNNGSPLTAMTILHDGNVGIGASSPTSKLMIEDTSNPDGTGDDAGTVIIRGRRDGTANLLTLQAVDLTDPTDAITACNGGIIRWQGFDGSDFEQMGAIAVTADGASVGYGDAPSKMTFYTTSDNSGTPTPKMTIDEAGDVGIGDTTPSKMLDIKNGASGGDILCYDLYTHDGAVTTSDERMKTNITDPSLGLNFINALKPRSYKWKDTPESTDDDNNFFKAVSYTRTHYGLIAQEVKQVIDDLSLTDKDFAGWCYEEDRDLYTLRYTEFLSPLIKAVQELSAKVTALESK